MNNDEITTLDPTAGRVLNTVEETRKATQFDRIVATPPPSGRRRKRLALTGAGAGICALVGAVVFSPVAATATWTLQPTHPTVEQSVQQANECSENWDPDVNWPAVTPDDILLSETRGDSGLTIMRMGDMVIQCTDIGTGSPDWEALGEGYSAAPGKVATLSLGSTGDPGPSQYSAITGLAGDGVTGVDIVGPDGVVIVEATVEGGWFTAWWPGGSGGSGGSGGVTKVQDTVTVHTGANSTSYLMSETYADPD